MVSTDLPITAKASGSLKPVTHQTRPLNKMLLALTGKIVEIGLLMELIEHSAGSELELAACEDRNAVLGKLLRKCGSAVMVLEGRDTRCDYLRSVMGLQCVSLRQALTISRLDEVWMSLM